ncbi:MAG: general secretion pathway protein GspK [Candidatus Omnitrophica bacterium]|nr:general secretion pathway protein GspK [Candidatus Omnitrophota bacterium]
MKLFQPKKRISLKNSKGIILITVLWVTAVLTIIALSFAYTVKLEMKMARYQAERAAAYYLAKAGLERAIAQLEADKRSGSEVDFFGEGWAFNPSAYEDVRLFNGSYTVEVTDEAGKININTASEGLLRALPVIRDADHRSEICDSIADWIDADDNRRLNGAESAYYRSLKSPHKCKNGPMDALEELLLIKGFDMSWLYEASDDGLAADEKTGKKSFQDEGEEARADVRLEEVITVYTDGKINVNTAGFEALSLLLGTANRELAQSIIDYRTGSDRTDGTGDDTPFFSIDELKPVIGEIIYKQFSKFAGVSSNVFKIVSIGRPDNSKVTKKIEAVIDRSGYPSRIIYYRED